MLRSAIVTFLVGLLLFLGAKAGADNAEENSWILNYIEQKISTPQRQIHLQGVHGALSAKASVDRITIADQEGVWLEIEQAQIDWQRSALLQGYLIINKLTAKNLRLLRLPQGAQNHNKFDFTISDLPINVDIGQVSFDNIDLAKPAFGVAARLVANGAVKFINHDLAANVNIIRLDAPGRLQLHASYSTVDKKLGVKLDAFESPNGIIANLLEIKGRPQLELKVNGGGTSDNMQLNLRAKAGKREVLGGSLKIQPPSNGAAGKHIQLDLQGPVRLVMPPAYQSLFDDHSALWLDADLGADHSLIVHKIEISGSILSLDAHGSVTPDGFLRRVFLLAKLKPHNQHEPIKLPFKDGHITASQAVLKLDYGDENSKDWNGELNIQDFKTSEKAAAFSAHLRLRGLAQKLEDPLNRYVTMQVNGVLQHDATRIEIASDAQLFGGTPILIKKLLLSAPHSVVETSGTIKSRKFSGFSSVKIDDLRSLAKFFGTDWQGLVNIKGKTYIDFSSLRFSHLLATQQVDGYVKNFSSSLLPEKLRPLFAPTTKVSGELSYQNAGPGFKDFSVSSSAFNLQAAGFFNKYAANLKARLQVTDLHAIEPRLEGGATVTLTALGHNSIISLGAELVPIDLRINGQAIEKAHASAVLSIAGANRLMPRYSLYGIFQGLQKGKEFSGTIDYDDNKRGNITVQNLDLALAQPFIAAKLPDMHISSKAKIQGHNIVFTLASDTPSMPLQASGTYNMRSKKLDSAIAGQADLNLFNQFFTNRSFNIEGQIIAKTQLHLDNQSLQATGQLQIIDGNFYDIKHNIHLKHVNITGQLQGDHLTITSAVAQAMEGGDVSMSGSIELTRQRRMTAHLQAELHHIRYSLGGIFSTQMSGHLALNGDLLHQPLIDGNVLLEQSELLIARSFTARQPIVLQHIAPSSSVLRTLARANLLRRHIGKEQPKRVIANLNINIIAPHQFFVRGLGLNVEMGGQINLRNIATQMHPVGSFKMIRGEIELMGQRLNLDTGTATLNGSLQPLLDFTASTNIDKIAININLSGPSTNMKLILSSSPDLPQDEILAHLLFLHDLKQLSPLQLTQIISTLAQFSGEQDIDILGHIRQASGLANLDINSDADGEIGISAGRYLTPSTYINLSANQKGKTSATLNWDLSHNIKTKASLSSDNNNSAGIFFEKDY